MSMNNIPPQKQQELVRFQQMQQSLEIIVQQKAAMESQLKETELAVKELENAPEDTVVYQAVGGLMIKKSQKSLLEKTQDRKETLNMRVKSLTEQEKRIRNQFEEQRKKVEQILKESGYQM